MPRLARFAVALRQWVWKPSVKDEVDSELAFHVEMRTRELVSRGMDPVKAREVAIGRFGNIGEVHTQLEQIGRRRDRRERRMEWLDERRQDVVFALRQLRHNPTFALVAILTLGIGIGAASNPNTCIRGTRYRIITIVASSQIAIWVSPTAPTPSTFPASNVVGRTLDTTTSATRVCFSSITPRRTFCPYMRMVM